MIPTEPEYATFYRLHADVERTKAAHDRQQLLLARDRVKTSADWRALLTAKAEYEAALALMAAFVRRVDAMPAEPEVEAA